MLIQAHPGRLPSAASDALKRQAIVCPGVGVTEWKTRLQTGRSGTLHKGRPRITQMHAD